MYSIIHFKKHGQGEQKMTNFISFTMILLLWNLATFIIMGIDKRKAIKGKWRVSEKSLFYYAYLFGGFGIWMGMLIFRHKTKHLKFNIFIPLAVLLNIILIYIIKMKLL